jgi:hypothetical protein
MSQVTATKARPPSNQGEGTRNRPRPGRLSRVVPNTQAAAAQRMSKTTSITESLEKVFEKPERACGEG